MIDYSEIKVGDKLRIVGAGAPGFAKLGDVVTVVKTGQRRVGNCILDVGREPGDTPPGQADACATPDTEGRHG